MAKWLLIDGYNLSFRAFFAIPEMTRSDGFPTNAILGWLRSIWYLQDNHSPDHMIAFFDLGRSEYRHALSPTYKANRIETPLAFKEQVPWIKKSTQALGISLIEKQGIEADDLIASAALKLHLEGNEVYIVSSDKDFAQLLRPNILQLLPPPTANPKLGWRVLNHKGVQEKFGVSPDQIVDYLALIGDTSDNIPGIPGVGPKTASKWIQEYGRINNILNKANYITPPRFQTILPQQGELIKLNVQMITLHTNIDTGPLEDLSPNPKELLQILDSMEMHRTCQEARKRFNIQ